MTSGCEPVRPGCQAAFDRLGDEEGEYSVGMGQTRAPTAVAQVVKDGREILAVRALAGQFLEQAAGFPSVWEWRAGAEISCSRLFPLISERCLHSGGGMVFVAGLVRGRL